MEHIDLGPNLHLEVLSLLLSEEALKEPLHSKADSKRTARGNDYLVQGPKSIKSSLRSDIQFHQLKEIGRYYKDYTFTFLPKVR